jgi:mannosyltransferase OCH1-like enzyme
MIPRIIHQSWKTNDVPEPWLVLQRTWRSLHPDYEYHFWTDADNRDFIVRHCPEYLDLYDGYPLAIHRAELARYLVLRHHGGLYVDLDFEALKSLDDLLSGASLLFGLEPASHAAREPVRARGLARIVCNALMASAPGHPFWDHFLGLLATAGRETNVLDATGPFLLTRACDGYPTSGDIVFAPARLFYPLDVEEIRKLSAEEIRAKAEGAYAVHHWAGSWWRDSLLARARDRIKAAGANSAEDRQ